jgi:hypothetical protein
MLNLAFHKVKRITLSKNIFRALESNLDRPPLSAYPRGHQVTFRYYSGMISFLNEEYVKVRPSLLSTLKLLLIMALPVRRRANIGIL